MGAGQFRCIVGGEQDGECLPLYGTPALDSLRLSGDVPEPGLANLEALAAATGRSIIDDGVFYQKLLDLRQDPGRFAFAAITKCVVVGTIGTFLYEQVYAAKRNVQNSQLAAQQRKKRYLDSDFFSGGKMGTRGPFRIADGYILDDDSRAQGSFQTDGAVDLELPVEGCAGPFFQLISINRRIHKNQSGNRRDGDQHQPD